MSIIVKKVRIQNFRSLKDVEIELEKLTVLVGANNSGKTSFLKALTISIGNERKVITRDDLFINKDGSQESNPITIDLYIRPEGKEFDENWILEFGDDIQTDTEGNDFFAFRTQVTFSSLNDNPQIERFSIKDWDSKTINTKDKLKASIEKLPMFFMDAQRDLQEELKNPSSYFVRLSKQIKYDVKTLKELEKQLNILNEDVVSKSDVLKHIKTQLEELNQTVQNRGKGVEITPLPKKLRDIHKGLKVHFQDGNSDTFGLEYHGMGTRSWASILSFKAFINWEAQLNKKEKEPFHPLITLEEPEAHLHPNAQRHVYSQLKAINGQNILSTHSPHIVAQAGLNEIRLFYKETDETKVYKIPLEKFNPDERRRMKNEVLMSKGEIIFSKLVILTEGQTEELLLPLLAESYFSVSLFEKGATLIRCDGNNYKPYLNFLNSLKIPWCIISDFDKPDVKNGVKNALKDVGLNPENEFENVIKLGFPIEQFLIKNGLLEEIKEGIIDYFKEITQPGNIKGLEAKKKEIANWKETETLKELSDNKTRYPNYFAKHITKKGIDKYPDAFKKLFEYIKTHS